MEGLKKYCDKCKYVLSQCRCAKLHPKEEELYSALVDDAGKPDNSVLDQAKVIIYGDREQTYGSPDKNLKVIASYWSNHLSAAKGVEVTLNIDDVCVMMVLMKAARLANSPKHTDSLVDICGYVALADRCNNL